MEIRGVRKSKQETILQKVKKTYTFVLAHPFLALASHRIAYLMSEKVP